VRFDNAMALARKYLEPIPRQDPPPPVRTKEPPQQGERRVTLSKPAQLPILMVLYHVPETKSPDTPAIQVLQTLLTQGQSSRLYKSLVDTGQLAIGVNGMMGQTLDPTVFTFVIQPRSGVDPAAAEKALYDELARVADGPVPDAELRKAKNQMLAMFYRSLKTIEGRANALGTYEVFHGDHSMLYSTDKRIEAVTAADVRRVAGQYFTAKNRTVATLVPEKPEVSK
jgi:zinc protease